MESSERAFDEYQARLLRSDIAGVSFPRTTRTQFRGLADSVDQFTVPKVLRAIGGDPTPTIGSHLFWLAHSVLVRPEKLTAGSPVPFQRERLGLPTPLATAETTLSDHGILGDVQRLLACRASYDDRDADIYARDLSLKALRNFELNFRDQLTRYLFAYNTREFASYGDDGWLHIYSTLYPSIAEAYGAKVLVFANAANQSLDLNYWNYRENKGIWSAHDGDRSEFVTAVNIAPEAVLGIWKTDQANRDKTGRDKTMRPRRLSYALMRLDVAKVHYAAILDARTIGCVIPVAAHFEGCQDHVSREWKKENLYDVSQIELGPLIPDGKPLPVIAVVRACPAEDTSCSIPDSVFAEMPPAVIGLTSEQRSEISSASFANHGHWFVQRMREAPRSRLSTRASNTVR
jgi:hypothetical protein